MNNQVIRYCVRPKRQPKTRKELMHFGVEGYKDKELALEHCQKQYKSREYVVSEYLCEQTFDFKGENTYLRYIERISQTIIKKPKDPLKQAVKEFNRLKDQGNDLEDIFEIAMNK